MVYIQLHDREHSTLETVDEFETSKEANEMLAEYRMSHPSGEYYTSSRACNDWND
jgi:hypothetical protein